MHFFNLRPATPTLQADISLRSGEPCISQQGANVRITSCQAMHPERGNPKFPFEGACVRSCVVDSIMLGFSLPFSFIFPSLSVSLSALCRSVSLAGKCLSRPPHFLKLNTYIQFDMPPIPLAAQITSHPRVGHPSIPRLTPSLCLSLSAPSPTPSCGTTTRYTNHPRGTVARRTGCRVRIYCRVYAGLRIRGPLIRMEGALLTGSA